MTTAYRDQRQQVYFMAARALRKIAAQVLLDCTELDTAATLHWAKELAKSTVEQANELENRGHECGIASNRQETEIAKSHRHYSEAINHHMKLTADLITVHQPRPHGDWPLIGTPTHEIQD